MNMRASLAFFVAATAATQIGAGAATSTASVDVRVQRGRPLGTFDRAFASVTYDIQNFIGFDIAPWSFNWSSPQLRNLLAPMSPMTVRCGGTWEDGIFWEGGPKTGRNPRTKPAMAAHTLTASAWDPFAQTMSSMAGVDLVVGLGALWRDWEGCDDVGADGVCPGAIPWDSANARAFIQHNREAGHTIWGYELGNEPGVWNWTWGVPIVTPQQHAADYAALQAVLAKEYSSGSTTRPKVVGPDTTWGPVGDEKPDGTGRNPVPGKGGPCYDYWNATLQRAPALDVAAFHYYAVQPGVVRSWRDFASIARNGSMCTAVAAHAKDLASSPLAGKVPLWLGEGGATYGGFPNAHVMGKNWLRLFGGGLSYLEDLGCAASNGARVFARQQLSNFLSGNRTAGSSHAAWDYTPLAAAIFAAGGWWSTCFFIPAGFCALLGALACCMAPVPPGGAVARQEAGPDDGGRDDGDGEQYLYENENDHVEQPLLLDEVAAVSGASGYGTDAVKADDAPEAVPGGTGGGGNAQQDAALGFLEALKIPGVVQYAVAYAFIKCVNYTLFFWLPYYLKFSLHYTKAKANAISTSFDIGSMIGGFFCGWLSDRLRKHRALASVPMLFAAIPLMLLYRVCGGKGPGANFVIMLLVGVMLGGPTALYCTAVSADLGAHKSLKGKGRALATVTAIIDGTGSVGAAAEGMLFTLMTKGKNYDAFFYLLMALAGVSGLIMLPLLIKDWRSYYGRR